MIKTKLFSNLGFLIQVPFYFCVGKKGSPLFSSGQEAFLRFEYCLQSLIPCFASRWFSSLLRFSWNFVVQRGICLEALRFSQKPCLPGGLTYHLQMTLHLLLDLQFLPFFLTKLLVRPGLLFAVLLTYLRYVLSILYDSFLSVRLLSYPKLLFFPPYLWRQTLLLWFPLLSFPNVGILCLKYLLHAIHDSVLSGRTLMAYFGNSLESFPIAFRPLGLKSIPSTDCLNFASPNYF